MFNTLFNAGAIPQLASRSRCDWITPKELIVRSTTSQPITLGLTGLGYLFNAAETTVAHSWLDAIRKVTKEQSATTRQTYSKTCCDVQNFIVFVSIEAWWILQQKNTNREWVLPNIDQISQSLFFLLNKILVRWVYNSFKQKLVKKEGERVG